MFFQKEGTIKISNDNWKLITFKNITLLKSSFEQNIRAQKQLNKLLLDPRLNTSFKIPFQTRLNLLNTLDDQVSQKLKEITLIVPNRFKRGIINGIGSLFKIISGNLDASDGEYYNECINKLEKDDKELQLLMKNQIQVVSSTIKNFNLTLRKLQIDESIFNDNLRVISIEIEKTRQTKLYFEIQFKILELTEQIVESIMIIQSELDDIIDSITFARLNIPHPSIIDPDVLLEQLDKIPSQLIHGNLPFTPTHEHLSKLLSLIKIKSFQTNERIIFILQIPIIESSIYDLFHIFALPTKNPKTNLFHVITPVHKYVAISRDSKQYIAINLNDCTTINEGETRVCYDYLAKTLTTDSPCEVSVLMESTISPNCEKFIIGIEDHNIQKLGNNKWLLVVSHKLPITTICPNVETNTVIINENSILSLKPKCNAFIGSTQVYATVEENKTISSQLFIPEIQFDCCEHLPKEENLPKLTPIKINHLNLDELNLADQKLREFDENLNKSLNEPFATRYWSTFTYVIIISVFLAFLWLLWKCCFKRLFIGYFKNSNTNDDQRPGSCCPQIFNYCNVRSTRSEITRRPSLHLMTSYNTADEEINFQSENPTRIRNATRKL